LAEYRKGKLKETSATSKKAKRSEKKRLQNNAAMTVKIENKAGKSHRENSEGWKIL
jgi:hypothetical protein